MPNLIRMRAELARLKAAGAAKVAEYNALAGQIAQMEAAAASEAEGTLEALAGEIDGLKAECDALAARIADEERRAATFQTFAGQPIPRPGARTPAAPRAANEPHRGQNGGFASMAEFATLVRAAEYGGALDARLAALPTGTFTTGGNSGEGFLIPADFRDQIWEAVGAPGDLLADTDTDTTESNRVQYLKDESTPWGASGIVARWRAEGAPMEAGKFATKGAQVDLNELYAFTLATDELLADAPLLASRLTRKAGEAIRWAASDAVMWGNGVGKPLGFMRSNALVTVDKESGQAAKTLQAENVAKMFARLLPGNVAGAKWRINSEVLPQIMTLRIGAQPIWTPPSAGFAQAPGGYLLGRPIEMSEHCAALGDVGDVTLCDLKGYYAPTKATGVEFASSIHLYFDRGLQAFRWTFRIGGQPYLSAPVAPAKGSATKSHFVALAARQ